MGILTGARNIEPFWRTDDSYRWREFVGGGPSCTLIFHRIGPAGRAVIVSRQSCQNVIPGRDIGQCEAKRILRPAQGKQFVLMPRLLVPAKNSTVAT